MDIPDPESSNEENQEVSFTELVEEEISEQEEEVNVKDLGYP